MMFTDEWEVRISEPEMVLCHLVASQRIAMNFEKNVQPKYNSDNDEMKHIRAARGEFAVAKATGLFWSGEVGNYKAADVGGLIQVRTTAHPAGRLMLHPADDDGQPFVLVIDEKRIQRLRGWLWGREAKRPEWWQDPRGDGSHAYFVDGPLRPMLGLMKEIADRYDLFYHVWSEE